MALEWGTYCLRNLWEIPLEWLSSPASVDSLHLDCHTLEPLPWSEWSAQIFRIIFICTELQYVVSSSTCVASLENVNFQRHRPSNRHFAHDDQVFKKALGVGDQNSHLEIFNPLWRDHPGILVVQPTTRIECQLHTLFVIAGRKLVCLFVGSGCKAISGHIVFVLSLESLAFMSIESLVLFRYAVPLLWFWSWVFVKSLRTTIKFLEDPSSYAYLCCFSQLVNRDGLPDVFAPCWSFFYFYLHLYWVWQRGCLVLRLWIFWLGQWSTSVFWAFLMQIMAIC